MQIHLFIWSIRIQSKEGSEIASNFLLWLLFLSRDLGVDILSAVDNIQVMLDDNILKVQTMRGSPYVKAFEAEMQAWESKLISMQDILDAWLEVILTYVFLKWDIRWIIFHKIKSYLCPNGRFFSGP